jgi:hypothetical protein
MQLLGDDRGCGRSAEAFVWESTLARLAYAPSTSAVSSIRKELQPRLQRLSQTFSPNVSTVDGLEPVSQSSSSEKKSHLALIKSAERRQSPHIVKRILAG